MISRVNHWKKNWLSARGKRMRTKHMTIYGDMDVGQNGRPLRGPQMWKSSLVLTIQLLGYLILTHTHITKDENILVHNQLMVATADALFLCYEAGGKCNTQQHHFGTLPNTRHVAILSGVKFGATHCRYFGVFFGALNHHDNAWQSNFTRAQSLIYIKKVKPG